MPVLPTEVLAFLGSSEDAGASGPKLEAHIAATTAMVRAYVRDNGFDAAGEPAADLAAVIVSCTARQYANPTHERSVAIDDAQMSRGTFHGWTLPELAVLHRYRARAQ